MKINKEKAFERAREHHSPTGRVMKALNVLFSTTYPAGTNLLIEFLKMFIGMKYGSVNMCMDRVTDCAEYLRIGLYILTGIDPGSWTDGQYYDRDGTTMESYSDDLSDVPLLAFIFVKTNAKKKTGHVMMKISDKEVIHSGAKEHGARVGISKIWWAAANGYKIVAIRTFLDNDEYNSLIVDNADSAQTPPTADIEKCRQAFEILLRKVFG